MNVFHGKKALVTGATGGLGREISRQLIKSGCSVFLLGTNLNKLEKLHLKLDRLNKASSGPCGTAELEYQCLDFCDLDSLQEFLEQNNKFDILINCAGIFPIINFTNSSIADYNRCFDINVRAPFLLSKVCSENMKTNKWGRIVNIGSSSSYGGSEDTGLYCASKHALLGLSRSFYKELKPHNIRVYTVSPGSIQTEMGANDTRQDFSTFLNPSEVAEYVLYVMSQDNELIAEEIRLNRVIVR
jgi:NAD(P)-dependent dehydrogenase (short-subunit alcohol dehydrogenase family)